MSALQYTLPSGVANIPVSAEDGSLWVNHFSGLFRLHHGEVVTILSYEDKVEEAEHGFTWASSPPLNQHYSRGAHLPSPVSYGGLVYVCCHECPQQNSCILCFSSRGTMLWNLPVNDICTHLLTNAHGVFALCRNSLKRIGNATVDASIPLLESSEIISYHVVEEGLVFIVKIEQQVRLLQISNDLRLITDYLLDEGSYRFYISTNYPLISSNHHHLFVFFPASTGSFSGMDEFRFRFDSDRKLIFEGKNSYGVSSSRKLEASYPGTFLATETGFIFTDLLATGCQNDVRLWQVETEQNTVSITKLPDEVKICGGFPPLVIRDYYLIPCYDLRDRLWIGIFHNGNFQMKRCPHIFSWSVHDDRIWISLWKKDSYLLRQMPDWFKE